MTKLLTFKNIISLVLLLLLTLIVIYLMYPELFETTDITENFEDGVDLETVRKGIALAWKDHMELRIPTP